MSADHPPVAAEGLRERTAAAVEDWFNHLADDDEPTIEQIGQGVADAVLAALAGDSGEDLRAVMAADLRQAIDYELTTGGAEGLAELLASLEDPATSALVTAALGVRDEHLAHMTARALYAEGQLSARGDHETRWEIERARATEAERQRDAAGQDVERLEDRLRKAEGAYSRLDTQKQDAERVMVRWRARGEEAEAERDLLRETLADTDLGAQVLAQWEAIAAADADRDRLQAERDALKAARDRLGKLIESYPSGSDFAQSGAQDLFRRMHALDAPKTTEET